MLVITVLLKIKCLAVIAQILLIQIHFLQRIARKANTAIHKLKNAQVYYSLIVLAQDQIVMNVDF